MFHLKLFFCFSNIVFTALVWQLQFQMRSQPVVSLDILFIFAIFLSLAAPWYAVLNFLWWLRSKQQARARLCVLMGNYSVATTLVFLDPLLHLHFNRHNKSCGMHSVPPGGGGWGVLTESSHWGRYRKSTCQDGQHKHFSLQAPQVQNWASYSDDSWYQTACDKTQCHWKFKKKENPTEISRSLSSTGNLPEMCNISVIETLYIGQ